MQYAGSAETKNKLLDATLTLLQTAGYNATTLNKIVAKSGVPRGSLYHHFPGGKHELCVATLQYSHETFLDIIQKRVVSVKTPELMIEGYLRAVTNLLKISDYQKGSFYATITLEMSATDDAIQHECQRAYQALLDMFAQKFSDFGLPLDSAQNFAMIMITSVEGALVLSRAQRNVEPLNIVKNHLVEQMKNLLSAKSP